MLEYRALLEAHLNEKVTAYLYLIDSQSWLNIK